MQQYSPPHLPQLHHPLGADTAFTPEALTAAVQRASQLPGTTVPAVCVLEFDGDLTDWLVANGHARPWPTWACFHTPMFAVDVEGQLCGIVPRTIGGPYAVLIAEQLAVCGARLVVGLTSAGRLRSELPIPSLVIATGAVRDEGTSYHYLPPNATVDAPLAPIPYLREELASLGMPVEEGCLWSTDAPYRETHEQIAHHASQGSLAVEMQAASLFAFATARRVAVSVVAHVSNGIDHTGTPFDRGQDVEGCRLMFAICRAGVAFVRNAR